MITIFSSGVSAAAAAYVTKEYCDAITAEMIEFYKTEKSRDLFLRKFGDSAEDMYTKLASLNTTTPPPTQNTVPTIPKPQIDVDLRAKIQRIRSFGATNKLVSDLATFDENSTIVQNFGNFKSTKLVPLLLSPHGPTNSSQITISGPTAGFNDIVEFLITCINIYEMNA